MTRDEISPPYDPAELPPLADGITALSIALRDASRAAEALTTALLRIEAAVAVIITTTAADAAPNVVGGAPNGQDLEDQGEAIA